MARGELWDDTKSKKETKGRLILAADEALTKKALVPKYLLYMALFITFTMPNLVYSGELWFDTLHIMKWFVTMVPVAIIAIVAGMRLLRYGARRTNFTLDPFAGVWLLIIMYITFQPLLVGVGKIQSLSGFVKEWLFFATLFAVYVIIFNSNISKGFHRAVLWGASVNAAVNVVFAELQVRQAHRAFMFILDTPGNYIGNTAQQEMFGLWMAMAVLNCVYLHLSYVNDEKQKTGIARILPTGANLVLLAINSWGLWSSTTRGAILSLLVGFVIMSLGFWRSGEKRTFKKTWHLFGVVFLLLIVLIAGGSLTGIGRNSELGRKMLDMVQNPTSIGSRISIWRTSWEVFLKKPFTGVGLGQYKWHFLDGQKKMFEKHPELLEDPGYEWQYTYWAHSEYLQWLCETGVIGTLLLAGLGVWWLWRVVSSLIKGEKIPLECSWGMAMLFLLWFDALFSRPYHRIENAVWMSFAFAVANKSLMPRALVWTRMDNEFIFRCFGGLMAGVSLFGLVFFWGGMLGDQLILTATTEHGLPAHERFGRLNKASRYLMARDDALEQRAYFYVYTSRDTKDAETFAEGVVELYKAMKRRPSSRVLFDMIIVAKQMKNPELLADLATYLKPGMFGISASGDILSQ